MSLRLLDVRVGLILAVLVMFGRAYAAPKADFYVAPGGNDAWSGTLPAPNEAGTDGPFATPARAREAVRGIRAARPVTVMLRGGSYFLAETLSFGPEDSGTEARPITYMTCPGEDVVLSGGRVIEGWKRWKGDIFVADVPWARQMKRPFKQLFVGHDRQIPARYPNYDPKHPVKGGWLYVKDGVPIEGKFSHTAVVRRIDEPGSWVEYDVDFPADGEYVVWIRYSAAGEDGPVDMNGKTALRVDGGEQVLLNNLPGTASRSRLEWARCGRLRVAKGRHVLRWENLKGGEIVIDGFVLADDPKYVPVGLNPPRAAQGRHRIIIHAESPSRKHEKALTSVVMSRREFYAERGELDRVADAPDAEIYAMAYHAWTSNVVKIKSIDTATGLVTLAGSVSYPFLPRNRYFVQNVLSELDSPGEWYLDRREGKVYFRPPAGEAPKNVIAPVLENVIRIEGDAAAGKYVGHLSFRGLTIAHSAGSSIHMRAAEYCSVEGCRFPSTGWNAVMMQYENRFNRVADCVIENAGAGGVQLVGYPPYRKDILSLDVCTKNTICNNYIHHCGRLYKGGAAIGMSQASENVISHNLIHDMPRWAVSVGGTMLKTLVGREYDGLGMLDYANVKKVLHGRNNIIEFNEMYNLSLETYDTGAYYSWGPGTGNVIRNNLIHDVVGYDTDNYSKKYLDHYMAWGIYLDDETDGAVVENNIVYRNPGGGIHVHNGINNVIRNNIFVGAVTRQAVFSNDLGRMTGNVLERNLFVYERPESVLYRIGNWKPEVVRADYNLFFQRRGKFQGRIEGPPDARTFAEWQRLGFDRHSIVADPLFEDEKSDDYRLRRESPAFKLGFKPIDVSKIGLQGEMRKKYQPKSCPEPLEIFTSGVLEERMREKFRGCLPVNLVWPAGRIVVDGDITEAEWGRACLDAPLVLAETPSAEPVSAPPSYAYVARKGGALYVAMRHEVGDTAGLSAQPPDWGRSDGAEVCFQAICNGKATGIFVLQGFPSGEKAGGTDEGVDAEGSKRLVGASKYAARTGRKEWTCEWAIPLDAAGIDAGKVEVLRFNVGAFKNAAKEWMAWKGTRGPNWRVADAGRLLFRPVPDPAARNLLSDGGWRPSRWLKKKPPREEELSRLVRVKEGRDGAACLKIQCADEENAKQGHRGWSQTLSPIEPGKYRFSFWVRTEDIHVRAERGGLCFYAHVYWQNDTHGPNLGQRNNWLPEGSVAWTRRECVFDVPEGTKFLTLTFCLQRSTGTVWIDDVVFQKL